MSRDRTQAFSIVITGGPCGGKTEVWQYLCRAFPWATGIPEMATHLILSGRSQRLLGLERFQLEVYRLQLEAEDKARHAGGLVICDRGIADGFAYLPCLSAIVPVPPEEAIRRYDLVLQLEVIPDPALYYKHRNNPARSEDHEAARRIEESLQRLYSLHPCYHFLRGSLHDKKARALAIIIEELDY